MNIKDIEKQMRNFEEVSNYKLPEQSYVAVRVDGKNFSRVTQLLDKPFDDVFATSMEYVLHRLVSEIDGCIFGYTQSDEITLILHSTRESTPYFGNRIQKLTSIIASKASLHFYKVFTALVMNYENTVEQSEDLSEADRDVLNTRIGNLCSVIEDETIFDCKCFVIPEDEMWNLIYWRQKDCYRNAFNAFAQKVLGESNCVGKSMKALNDELTNAGHDFNSVVPEKYKYGLQAIKDENGKWVITIAPKFKYDEIL